MASIGKNNDDLVSIARNYEYWLNIKSPRDEIVLEAMKKVDRSGFLPQFTKRLAYRDIAVFIGYGGTCSMPSLVVLMADMLELKQGMNVLEIGSGCGYSAAITFHLISPGKLTTVEIVKQLAVMARDNLLEHFGNLEEKIDVVWDDGSAGYEQNAPYDRIYLTASPNIETFKPEILLSQLKDNGILLFPESSTNSLFLYRKKKDSFDVEKYYGVEFIPLIGKNT